MREIQFCLSNITGDEITQNKNSAILQSKADYTNSTFR